MIYRSWSVKMNAATDTPTGAAGGAPAAVAAPAAEPAADPGWLPKRLEQAERTAQAKVLAELGIEDVAAAKAILAEAKAKQEAEKSAEQRAVELGERLKASQSEAERQAATVKEYAARMMGVLTEGQRKSVTDIAGEDPASQLRTINALQPLWSEQEKAAREAAAASAPPATTTAPADAPAQSGSVSPADHRSVYQRARSVNPFKAAAYGLEHAEDVYKST